MNDCENPFKSGSYDGRDFYALAAYDRIDMVRKFTLEQCQAALEIKGLQKTVRTAIERRMKQLIKESA